MEENIEKKVAEAVLQVTENVKIGEKTYKVAPPSVATLILASEAISRLPSIRLSDEKVIEESLAFAQDCEVLGEIAAIFILGARGLTETVTETKTVRKPVLGGLFHRTEEVTVERVIDHKAELALEIIETLTPSELHSLVAQILMKMEIQDFFALTTFLIEVNLLRQKKVGN